MEDLIENFQIAQFEDEYPSNAAARRFEVRRNERKYEEEEVVEEEVEEEKSPPPPGVPLQIQDRKSKYTLAIAAYGESDDEKMLETLTSIMNNVISGADDDETILIEDFEAMLIISSAKLRKFRMWRTICKIDFEDPVFARFGTEDGMINNGREFIRVVVLEVRLRLLFVRTFLALYDDHTLNIFDKHSDLNISQRVTSEDLLLSMNANPSLAALIREQSELRLPIDISQVLAADADAENDYNEKTTPTNLKDEMLGFCSRFNRPPDWISSPTNNNIHTSFSSSGHSRNSSPPDIDRLDMSPYSEFDDGLHDRFSPFTLDDGEDREREFEEEEEELEEDERPIEDGWRYKLRMNRQQKLKFVDNDDHDDNENIHFLSMNHIPPPPPTPTREEEKEEEEEVHAVKKGNKEEEIEKKREEEKERHLSLEEISNAFYQFAKRNKETLEMQMHRSVIHTALNYTQIKYSKQVLTSLLFQEMEIGSDEDYLTLVDFVYVARRLATSMNSYTTSS